MEVFLNSFVTANRMLARLVFMCRISSHFIVIYISDVNNCDCQKLFDSLGSVATNCDESLQIRIN